MDFSTSYYTYKNALLGYKSYDPPIIPIPDKEFDDVCGIQFINFSNFPQKRDEVDGVTPMVIFKILNKDKLDYARIKYGI